MKDGTYIVHLDNYKLVGTHWIALYANGNSVKYFERFGAEQIPEQMKTFIGRNIILTIIFRTQVYDLKMCGYFCIGFIYFMFRGKSLTNFTNIFSTRSFEHNDEVNLNYF